MEEGFDFTELLGDWELNGKAIKIDAKLEIEKQPIKILSDQQFSVQLNREPVVFNRIKPGRWISKGEKYKLIRVQVTKKKGNKKAPFGAGYFSITDNDPSVLNFNSTASIHDIGMSFIAQ